MKLLKRCASWVSEKRGWIAILLAFFLALVAVRIHDGGFSAGSTGASVNFVNLTSENFQQEMSRVREPIYVVLVKEGPDGEAQRITLGPGAANFAGKAHFYVVNVDREPKIGELFIGILAQNGLPVQNGVPMPLHILVKIENNGQNIKLLNANAGIFAVADIQMFLEAGFNPAPRQPQPGSGATPTPAPSKPVPDANPATPAESPTAPQPGS